MTTPPAELSCRDLAAFLDDYLADMLEPAGRASFEEHLAACPDCRTYLRSYADTLRFAKDAYADEPVADAVPEGLVRAILSARSRSTTRRGPGT